MGSILESFTSYQLIFDKPSIIGGTYGLQLKSDMWTSWLIDLIVWLIDWSTDWLIYWLLRAWLTTDDRPLTLNPLGYFGLLVRWCSSSLLAHDDTMMSSFDEFATERWRLNNVLQFHRTHIKTHVSWKTVKCG